LPLNLSPAHFGRLAFNQGVRIAPPEHGPIDGAWLECESQVTDGVVTRWLISGSANQGEIILNITAQGPAADRDLAIILPSLDRRSIRINQRVVDDDVCGLERRIDVVVG
jgi:hypothetical protein